MTRQHFEVIAHSIQRTVAASQAMNGSQSDQRGSAQDSGREQGIKMVVNAISDACASINPRFDRARFLAACGVN